MRDIIHTATTVLLGLTAMSASAAATEKPLVHFAPRSTCGESAALAGYSMTYDPDRRQVVIFGGPTANGAGSAATWGWDGRSWQCIAPESADGPSPRDASMLAYDARRHVLVLYGGRVGRQGLRDTWELGSTGWKRKNENGPAPEPHGVMAYDAESGGILLFHSLGEGPERATWRWDGTAWTKIADGPNEQFPNAMFASEGSRTAMLVTAQPAAAPDAFNPPVYEWTDNGWKPVAVKGDVPVFSPQAPAARTATGALFYAGFESNGSVTTSVLDGATWRRYDGESPPRRRNAQMIFDPVRSVVVLHAGYDGARVLTDTWEWNGKHWTKVK